jgi:hypothetical protein
MPHQREMTLQITTADEKTTLYSQKFRVNQPLAIYHVEKKGIKTQILSGEPIKLAPLSLQKLSNGYLKVADTDAHYTIKNRDARRMIIVFEFRFKAHQFLPYPSKDFPISETTPRNPHQLSGEKYIAIPMVIPPNETIKLSKEFLKQTWRDLYMRSNSTRSITEDLSNPNLELLSIQPTAYPT